MTGLILTGAILAIAVWLSLKHPRGLLYAAIALSPWQGLDFDVGLRVTASRILLGILLLPSLARLTMVAGRRGFLPIVGPLKALAVYAVLLSLARIPFLPSAQVAGGALRAPAARSLFQCVYFLAIFGSLLVIPFYLRTAEEVRAAGAWFLRSLVLLAGLGWLQLALWYGVGWNPFPIGLIGGGDPNALREATIVAGDTTIHRMNALGGEPKDLAQGMTVGLFLLQALWLVGDRAAGHRRQWAWILLFLSMFATLSTSAIFMWLVGTVIQLFAQPFLSRGVSVAGRQRFRVSGAVGAVAFLAALCLLVPKDLGRGQSLTDLILSRTVERLELEDYDQAISQFLVHEPEWLMLGVGLGDVHLHADRYLPEDSLFYAAGTAFRSKMGLLRVLSELGMVGLGLWTGGVLAQILRLRRAIPRLPPSQFSFAEAVPSLGVALLAAYSLVSGVEEMLYLVLGTMVALTAAARRQARAPSDVPRSRVMNR
jgi:hypothetical protein